MADDETLHIAIEHGRISTYVEIPELVIRCLPQDPDLGDSAVEGEASPATGDEYRLQGRILNKTRHRLSAIKYDVSYYDAAGAFLGLDRSNLLDDDELEEDDFLAIDKELSIPGEATRCVFNCRAQKTGVISRLFWG